jgi:hypothetical protein
VLSGAGGSAGHLVTPGGPIRTRTGLRTIGEEEAFDLLRRARSHRTVELRLVAET